MQCTVEKTAEIVAKKWTLLIILSVYKGGSESKRYSEIKALLPKITPKMLSARLRELKKCGILKRKVDNSKVPISTFYSLTPSGRDLIKIIKDIKTWGLKWKFKNRVCRDTLCRDCVLEEGVLN